MKTAGLAAIALGASIGAAIRVGLAKCQ